MIRPGALAAVAALVLAVPSLHAQRPTTRPQPQHQQPPARGAGAATLVGIAIDSLGAGPLVGATVIVEGAIATGESDSQGRFRIDSIPPGERRLAIYHPLLDSLGIGMATPPLRFAADSVREVTIAVPSAATLAARWCSPATRRLGSAIIVGRVTAGESSEPVAGARASIVWEEIAAVAGNQVRPVPRLRSASTDSSGRYVLCGLPSTLRGTLQVEKAGARTSELPIVLEGRDFLWYSVLLGGALATTPAHAEKAADGAAVAAAAGTPSQPAASAPARLHGTAVLAGRVVDARGAPVSQARVQVEGTGASALTDSSGAFLLTALPAGTWKVTVKRIGATPVEAAVTLPPRRRTELAVTMEQAVPELARVTVRDRRTDRLDAVGFTARARSGMGHYLSPEDVDQAHPLRTTDLLQAMPGITVVSNGRGGWVLRSTRDAGRGCVNVYIDGMSQMQTGADDLNELLPAGEVGAVEVYSAGTAPGEFTTAGAGNCAAVVIWTRARLRR